VDNLTLSTAHLSELQPLFPNWELQAEAKVGLLYALALEFEF
jgi:hypothetical protein